MSGLSRLGAIAVGIIVAVAIGFLVLRAAGAGIGLGPGESDEPTASATPSADPTEEPSVAATPSSPTDDETLAILAEIEEQVIAIRGLEAADIGPAEIITRAEVVDELERLFEEEYPPEEREEDNITLRALGLLAPDEDVAELQLELLGDQVLGFYDDTDKRMVVVSDAGLDVEARITYAHEYTHALQDAAYSLDSIQTDEPGDDDRDMARLALIEGDATVTMLAWMFRHLDESEILDYLAGADVPDTSGIPSWMVGQLAFPYDSGLVWAQTLSGGDPFSPDYTAIDAAFADPPDSTEQILELDAWESREAPVPVDAPDLAAALGEGWAEVEGTPVGQANIAIFLEHLGVARPEAQAAADGWGGDHLVVASGPDEAFAVAWRLAWDASADVDEFVDAYQEVVESLAFPASVTVLPSGEVLVAHASDADLLDRTVDAAN